MTATPKPRAIAVFALIAASLGGLFALAQSAAPHQPAQPPVAKAPAKPATTTPDDPGERAFKANCYRCHGAPEELSPRISGTVLRHMRVRASLSAADERAILHFLAP